MARFLLRKRLGSWQAPLTEAVGRIPSGNIANCRGVLPNRRQGDAVKCYERGLEGTVYGTAHSQNPIRCHDRFDFAGGMLRPDLPPTLQ